MAKNVGLAGEPAMLFGEQHGLSLLDTSALSVSALVHGVLSSLEQRLR